MFYKQKFLKGDFKHRLSGIILFREQLFLQQFGIIVFDNTHHIHQHCTAQLI